MLYILNHTIIATIVTLAVLFPALASEASPTLAERAAGLSIDETLEREGRLKSVTADEVNTPSRPPLLPKRKIPNTAAPSFRLPLYMYRSYDNNFREENEIPTRKPEPKPETKTTPPTAPVSPSPAEMAVEKDLKKLRNIAPAAGEGTPENKPVSAAEANKLLPSSELDEAEKVMHETIQDIKEKEGNTAPEQDDKEKAMRETINTIKQKNGEMVEEKPVEPAPEPKSSTPSRVTRIGSVPSMEKEVDYVGVLEKSLLLDPQPLPVKLPFYDEDGNPVTLKQFKGKLILLNFWATWCTPCAMEMPSLDALQENFDDKELPIKVLALSQDFKGVPTIRAFYDQNKITLLDIYHDRKNGLFRELGVISLPTTLLIDQQGQEILRMSGYIDWHKPEVQEFVRGFLRD